jgi:hypothetical protein
MAEWFVSNKLTVNQEKTYFILHYTKNKPIPIDFQELYVNGYSIQRMKSFRYIGLILDETLTWNEHINEIIKKVVKFFGIFNKLKHSISIKLARQLYFAFIYPHIKYGIEVYGNCTMKSIDKLQIIQNKLMKVLLNIPYRYSTNLLHKKLNILKVKDIYTSSLDMLVYDCLHCRCPPLLNNLFSRVQSQINTRQNTNLFIEKSRTELGKKRISVTGATRWNNIEKEVRILERNHFKNTVRNSLISGYDTE